MSFDQKHQSHPVLSFDNMKTHSFLLFLLSLNQILAIKVDLGLSLFNGKSKEKHNHSSSSEEHHRSTTRRASTTTTSFASSTSAAPNTCPSPCQDEARACPRTQCLDLYSECAGWAKLGYCTSSPESAAAMEKNCPVSCGYCNEICEDYACPDDCATRALAGECTKNPEFMLVRCKKTCQYCDRCTNLNSACPYLVNQCTNQANIPNMYFYCRATCGLCTPVSNCSVLDPTTKKCPRDWLYSPLTNQCYWATPNFGAHDTIQGECAQAGGNLISIHSDNETNFITSALPNAPNSGPLLYFIGLSRPSGTSWNGGARWQDNSPVDYIHWDAWSNPPQPSSSPTELNSAITLNGAQPGGSNQLTTGYWQDVLTTDQYAGFCERPICVAPSTAAIKATTKA